MEKAAKRESKDVKLYSSKGRGEEAEEERKKKKTERTGGGRPENKGSTCPDGRMQHWRRRNKRAAFPPNQSVGGR